MKYLFILIMITSHLSAQEFRFDKKTGRSIPSFVGELKIFKGKVFKLTQGQLKEVQAGTRFFKDDSLVTQEDSSAKLMVVDDSIVNLGPNSELKFEEFMFEAKGERRIFYALEKGQLTAHIKIKAREGDIKFRTKLATMGIRGTRILINHQTVKAMEVSQFALLTGNADVIDDKAQKHPLQEGDKIVIVRDSTANGESASDKSALSKQEFDHLNAKDKNEDSEFWPFLPYFEPDNLNKNSELQASANKTAETSPEKDKGQASEYKNEGEKKTWRENLQKLNDELRKNQKKR